MGQKVHPVGFRVGITESWRSNWYAPKRGFGRLLLEDHRIRSHIRGQYGYAGISRIDIERTRGKIQVRIVSARPGVIIGRKGAELENLKEGLTGFVEGDLDLRIEEVEMPELDAQLVADGIAEQMKKRAPWRRAIKRALEGVQQAGAKGVKLQVSGRLGGSEIARTEKLGGGVPLHTLQARVEYGFSEAQTSAGTIGVKVWIYKGSYLEDGTHGDDAQARQAPQAAARTASR